MSFSKDISTWGEKTAKRVQLIRRGVTLKIFNAVIRDTPVDTGRLRANWLVQLGEPQRVARDLTDKAGTIVYREVENAVKASTGDVPVTLTNNLPYAATAEYGGWHGPTEKVLATGFSKKSPHGMVRRNVARIARLVQAQVNQK